MKFVYSQESIQNAFALLNKLNVQGIENNKIIVTMFQILDHPLEQIDDTKTENKEESSEKV